MTTIIKGKTKTSVSFKRDSICLISEAEYEWRKLPENLATYIPRDKDSDLDLKDSVESIQATNYDKTDFKSEAAKSNKTPVNEPAEKLAEKSSGKTTAAKSTEKSKEKTTEEPTVKQVEPLSEPKASPSKKSSPRKIKFCQNAETQCELDKNDSPKKVSTEEIKKINYELNAVFANRAADIKEKAPKAFELRIKTYEEWIDTLIKSNKAIIECTQNLKSEFEKFTDEPETVSETELKFERDRDELVKVIRKRVRTGEWKFDNLKLETVPLNEILNIESDHLSDRPSGSQGRRSTRSRRRQKSPFTKPQT